VKIQPQLVVTPGKQQQQQQQHSTQMVDVLQRNKLIRVPLAYFTDAPMIVHCPDCHPVPMIGLFGEPS